MSTASKEELANLHNALAKALAERVASGDATAADLAVAVKFLKDNGINAEAKPGTPLGKLAAALPFADADAIAAEHETLQ